MGDGSLGNGIVILAPSFTSLARFKAKTLEVKLQLMAVRDAQASLTNLDALINSPLSSPPLGRGLRGVGPMAGYYLESHFKKKGYSARNVYDWEDSTLLDEAMAADPVAILFSTTFITEADVLAGCLEEIRHAAGGTPVVVGGPFIHKQAALLDGISAERTAALAKFGVDAARNNLFGPGASRVFDNCIFVADLHGVETAERVVERVGRGRSTAAELADVDNLVLRDPESATGWFRTRQSPEAVDLDNCYTRWDLVDEMPAVVPVRTNLGCAGKCRFCDFRSLHSGLVERSASSIVEELRLASARGSSHVNFVDDDIFSTQPRVGELAGAIVDAELSVIWGGFFRSEMVTESNIALLISSGFRWGLTGVESGDEDHLRRMGKGIDLGDTMRGLSLLADHNVSVDATFIVGFPGESESTLEATAAFIEGLPTGGKGHVHWELFPFRLFAGTVADTPGFRGQYALRGRGSSWSHDTASYAEAVEIHAPAIFNNVDSAPYFHGNEDVPPWWSAERRDRAFRCRAHLTKGFLTGCDVREIQVRFDDLFSVLAEGPRREKRPSWDDLLAPRSAQPSSGGSR